MISGEGTGRARDRLKQLRAFCHVARLESMSKAADLLSLSQPAISQQIRALETEFSATFFERRGPRIALTPAGASLYRIAMPLVRGMDRLPDAFTEHFHNRVSGDVHVLAGLTAAVFLLPDYLKRFQVAHGEVRVTLRTGGLAEGMSLIYDREVDFALGALEIVPETLDFHPFRTSRFVLIAHPDHPLARVAEASARDIAPWPMVMPARGTVARAAQELGARHFGVKPKVAVETRGWSIIKRLVEQDLGIAFVPDICVTERDRVRIVPIDERVVHQTRSTSYGVIVHRPEFLSLAARRLIQMMVPDFPDEPAVPDEPL